MSSSYQHASSYCTASSYRMKGIHEIPFSPANTPGFYTFVEAYKDWCRRRRAPAAERFHGETPWGHWYILNMWLCEESHIVPCPDCSLPMSDETGICSSCEEGSWSF